MEIMPVIILKSPKAMGHQKNLELIRCYGLVISERECIGRPFCHHQHLSRINGDQILSNESIKIRFSSEFLVIIYKLYNKLFIHFYIFQLFEVEISQLQNQGKWYANPGKNQMWTNWFNHPGRGKPLSDCREADGGEGKAETIFLLFLWRGKALKTALFTHFPCCGTKSNQDIGQRRLG